MLVSVVLVVAKLAFSVFWVLVAAKLAFSAYSAYTRE